MEMSNNIASSFDRLFDLIIKLYNEFPNSFRRYELTAVINRLMRWENHDNDLMVCSNKTLRILKSAGPLGIIQG